MINPTITRKLSHGQAHINWDGTIIVQQGRPHGVMAVPGECMFTVKDLETIQDMLKEFKDNGHEVLDNKVIRPL